MPGSQTIQEPATFEQLKQWSRPLGETRLILLAALGIVLVRSPVLLVHGRVFAEEGTVYLQGAWDSGALQAMAAVHQGYYSLLMNGFSVVAAKLLPLELAGYLSVYAALGILLLTVYLAVKCEAFESWQARWLAAAVILFSPGVEVWLTLLDAQFYLAVCAGLIAISTEERLRGLRTGTLLLTGLTGPVSCAFTPFFLWKAWKRRTFVVLVQASILVMCSLTQGILLLRSVRAGSRTLDSVGKVEWFGPLVFLKVCSVTLATRLGGFLTQRLLIRHENVWTCVLLWLLMVACAGFFWFLCRLNRNARELLLMATASLVFNCAGDPAPLQIILRGEFRYFFTATTLLWLALVLGCASSKPHSTHHSLGKIVLALALFSGGADSIGYWTRLQRIEPRWSGQVAAWRHHPGTEMRVPPKDWTARILLRAK
jgi:hypothetical protein